MSKDYNERLFGLRMRESSDQNVKDYTYRFEKPLLIEGAQTIKKEELAFHNINQNVIVIDDDESEHVSSQQGNLIKQNNYKIKEEDYVLRSQDFENSEFNFQGLGSNGIQALFKHLSHLTNEVKELKSIIHRYSGNNLNTPLICAPCPDNVTHKNSNIEPLHENVQSLKSFTKCNTELPLNLPVELPISNEKDLKIIIDWVKDEINRNLLALALISDKTSEGLAEKVRATLRKLMVRRIALLFNWEGRNRSIGPKKSSFQKSGLWLSVFRAINCNAKEEYKAIKIAKAWFKQANPKRKR